MRFNIKLFNYKRLYIYFCLLALLNIFFSTENIQAKTFSINAHTLFMTREVVDDSETFYLHAMCNYMANFMKIT